MLAFLFPSSSPRAILRADLADMREAMARAIRTISEANEKIDSLDMKGEF